MHSTIVCCGTSPAITPQQVDAARSKGWPLYVCNNAFMLAPDAALLYAINPEWWRHYWPQVRGLSCEKWTASREAAREFPLNWIDERNGIGGFSEDPSYIHSGYGSGYSLCSMAHRAGATRIVLLGYSLRYAADYNGLARSPGSTPRHSTLLTQNGEYPESMRHWPSVKVKNGVHFELVDLYRCARDQGVCEIVNSTPGSALEEILPYVPIEEVM